MREKDGKKRCIKCGLTLPVTEFYPNRNNCKACTVSPPPRRKWPTEKEINEIFTKTEGFK